jgi:hypothetical protein
MSAKPKYTKYKPEILKMYRDGKKDAEIAKHINKRYGLNAPKSSIRSIIDRELKTEKEKKTIKAAPETKQEPLPSPPDPVVKELKEKLLVLIGKIEKNYSKQEKNALLQQKSLANLAELEAKYADGIEKHSILNEILHEMIICNREKNNRKYNPYLITGICILVMTFPLVAGYHSERYDDEVSFHYLLVLGYILGGILAGIGIAAVKKKIMAMIQKVKSKG